MRRIILSLIIGGMASAMITPTFSQEKIVGKEVKSEGNVESGIKIQGIDDDDVKVVKFDDRYSSSGAVHFTNARLTIIHVKPKGEQPYTAIRFSFNQYNHTQNNRGEHSAKMDVFLIGDSNNVIAQPYVGIDIVRNACRDQGTVTFPEVKLGTDLFNVIKAARYAYNESHTYEGGC